jgi:hypothetical protein
VPRGSKKPINEKHAGHTPSLGFGAKIVNMWYKENIVKQATFLSLQIIVISILHLIVVYPLFPIYIN